MTIPVRSLSRTLVMRVSNARSAIDDVVFSLVRHVETRHAEAYA